MTMTTVTAYEAKTHLPRLLRAAERGETVIITRHGKPVAQLGPVEDRRREDIAAVIERMKRARAQRPRVSVEEILAARDEGRKP
jgi:prevent-host-death family protein